jgi:hypothetical protein
MTSEERQRIDKLIADIADWRVEMKDDLIGAVREHQAACLEKHLTPLGASLDHLVANSERAATERAYLRRLRKRVSLAVGGVVTAIGIVTPFLIHYL